MGSAPPEVTVVVPTRDRPSSLARCVAALEAQRCTAEFEIVVVDDGSHDAGSVAAAVSGSPRARLIRVAGVGPAGARNHGARSAAGSLIVFTDDDCEPALDWLGRLTARLRAGADAAGGRAVNGLPHSALAEASQTIADYVVEVSAHPGRMPFATSNNLACTAAALSAVPFDERFRGAGGEDRDWCARLSARGFRLVAEPAALVVHRHRLDSRRFWRQHVAYGRGAYRFRRAHSSQGWIDTPRFYVGLVRRGFSRGPRVGCLVCLAQVATLAGFIREARAGGV